MQVIFIFLIIASIIGSVRTQNWLGIYTIDSTCNTTVCCCFTGQMLFVNYSTQLGIFFNTTGDCDKDTPSAVNTTYPSNYAGDFMMGDTSIKMNLSANSQSIALVDRTNSACNSNAVKKSNSIKQQIYIMMLFFLMFVSLIMNIIFP
jgi:hypothetical protein